MTRALSLTSGLLMVAAGALQGDRTALLASAVGLVAVLVGLLVPAVATLAVVATVCALGISEPPPVVAAIAGLAATAYLVLRHARGGETAMTVPTVVGATGLSAVAVLGAVMPLGLPWVPLVAPLAVMVIYAVIVDQYVGRAPGGQPLR